MDPFLGEIKLFAGNFAPRAWAYCDGQLLPISQYSALFSILGTTYGGDGRTTFALPDLRGRAAIHPGNGPGLSSYQLGQKGGRETISLNLANLPSHNHTATSTTTVHVGDNNNEDEPEGNFLGTGQFYSSAAAAGAKLNDAAVTTTTTVGMQGGQQAYNNLQPFLGVHYIIALQGVFPSRN
ncbi:tail fiber protein [uncultured Dokdonia sp.]|uniref:phage tail protein n=1 Tax=uncultured Dokdonia sp. TaxID=575653 RepID=UPI0026362BCA|nr:tail fiber protein [uncultured Dokdonia sp.]